MPLGLDYKVRHLDIWNLQGVGVRVKMSRNFDFRPTMPPQTPTPRRNGSAYQNLESTWRVPIISVADSNNCTNFFSSGGVAWHVYFTFCSNTFSGFLGVSSAFTDVTKIVDSSITSNRLQGGRSTNSIALATIAISSLSFCFIATIFMVNKSYQIIKLCSWE